MPGRTQRASPFDAIPMTISRRAARTAVPSLLVASAMFVNAGCAFHGDPRASGTGDGGTNAADASTGGRDALVPARDGGLLGGTDGPVASDDAGVCNHTMRVVVRDFRGFDDASGTKHPDFEYAIASQKGIVAEALGADTKPVYAPAGATSVTHGAAEFDQWYRDVSGVNERFEINIDLVADANRPGTYVYDNNAYYPIENMGFGNQGQQHNYHFTSETHFTFPYRGGEVFRFVGDDDLWLFVNGHLAIDIGGVHGAETGTVDLDSMAAALGIVRGNSYQMDIFHAERHTSESTFHIETTLACIDSIVIP